MIKYMKFEVASPCQLKCADCTHDGLMKKDRGFQLSLEELKRFIETTRESGYFIGTLQVHGPGEPTLWRHLNEGIKLLHQAGIFRRIIITTNGLNLSAINEESWRYLYRVEISEYPEIDLDLSKYKSKIKILDRSEFIPIPNKQYAGTIPCNCICPGPMFFKEKIYFYCGPPAFAAADLMGTNLDDHKDLWTPLRKNYMENYDPSKMGNLKLCEYCWANSNIKRKMRPHSMIK